MIVRMIGTVTLTPAKLLADGVRHAHGWSLAEAHAAELDTRLGPALSTPGAGTIVVLDFAGIESTSASYVKRILVWLLVAGERFVSDDKPYSEGPPALNVFPVITNPAPDVLDEVKTVLEHGKKACLEALEMDGGTIGRARVLGSLDAHLRQTLLHVVKAEETSAPDLYDRFRDEKIGVTAWNNRLNELHARRLVQRNKHGRQLVFRPLAKEIVDG
jgi:hypothetical protein